MDTNGTNARFPLVICVIWVNRWPLSSRFALTADKRPALPQSALHVLAGDFDGVEYLTLLTD